MKDIKAVRGSDLVRAMVAEGEHEHQDFKFAISDARKIARGRYQPSPTTAAAASSSASRTTA